MSDSHSLLLLVSPSWLSWNTKSNEAASASGIYSAHGGRQLLVCWTQSFGCLSSYGLSNNLYGFLESSSVPLPELCSCGLTISPVRDMRYRWSLEVQKRVNRRGVSTLSPILIFLFACFLFIKENRQIWFRDLLRGLVLRKAPPARMRSSPFSNPEVTKKSFELFLKQSFEISKSVENFRSLAPIKTSAPTENTKFFFA